MRRVLIPPMYRFYRDLLINDSIPAFIKALEHVIGAEIVPRFNETFFGSHDFRNRISEAFAWSFTEQGVDFWVTIKNSTNLYEEGFTAEMESFYLALKAHPEHEVVHKDMIDLIKFYAHIRKLAGRGMLSNGTTLDYSKKFLSTYFDKEIILDSYQRNDLVHSSLGFFGALFEYVLKPKGFVDGISKDEFMRATTNQKLVMLLDASARYKNIKCKSKSLTLNP